MDRERTILRFVGHLAPKGWLALVEEIHVPNPWYQQVASMIQSYSINKDFISYTMRSLAKELEQRHKFQLHESYETVSVPFRQPIDFYIQSFHARNVFSLGRMGPMVAT
jgi:hypothetical protein